MELNDNYIIAATNTQGVFRFTLSNLNLSTGISDFDDINAIFPFPNPTSNQLNIKVDDKHIGTAYIVSDNLGKIVFSGILNNVNTLIEMESLPRGIYLLSIGENMKQTLKIIKE